MKPPTPYAVTIDQLTPGTVVLRDDADPTDPDEVGTVVTPTDAEIAQARTEVCGFDTADLYDGEGVVLVAWGWVDEPGVVHDRSWEWNEHLQLRPVVLAGT